MSATRLLPLLALACACTAEPPDDLARLRADFPLGASLEQTRMAATEHCASVNETHYSPEMAAPYADQYQLDCEGYAFRGAPRKVELLVNDGALGFYWVLIESAELTSAETELRGTLGPPPCTNAEYRAAYPAQGVALRNEPAEFLIAEPEAFRQITGCG